MKKKKNNKVKFSLCLISKQYFDHMGKIPIFIECEKNKESLCKIEHDKLKCEKPPLVFVFYLYFICLNYKLCKKKKFELICSIVYAGNKSMQMVKIN